MQRDVCSRRTFLHLSTAAAAGMVGACGFARTSCGGDDAPWKMRLACSSINFSSLPIEQAVERIAKLGFDAIDIWSAYVGCPHLDDALNRLGPDALT